MIRLLALVNHDSLRASLEELFELAGDICIEAIATSAEECLRHLEADTGKLFDALLLDTAHAKELRVLVDNLSDALLARPLLALCPRNTPSFLRNALNTGNATFLEKDGDPIQLIAGIRKAVAERCEPPGDPGYRAI